MANTLTFFGIPLAQEPKQGANLIWSFHFGILKESVFKKDKKTGEKLKVEQNGWDSANVSNFNELITVIKRKKEAEKKMLIAMPTLGNHVVNFNLHDNLKAERLGITVHDGDIFLGIITVFDVTVIKRTPHGSGSAGFYLHEIKIGGNVDISPK